MANGQQIAEQNHAAFLAWATSKSDGDFREYVHRGKLKRSEIATECGFGKSALVQNPAIRSALESLEAELRVAGVLNWSSNPGHHLRCLCRFLLHGYWRQVVVVAVEPGAVVVHEESHHVRFCLLDQAVAISRNPL